MKLVIDIDEETYNDIQSSDWKNGELIFSEEWKAIHNGTPLDKVLEDINAEIGECWQMYEERFGVSECLDIIDKYKAESEDKG